MKPKIAISIGDPNGIGPEIALKAHDFVGSFCNPVYFAGSDLLEEAASRLGIDMPEKIECISPSLSTTIIPGMATAESGAYSFASFKKAIEAVCNGSCKAIVTLPIHKEAWMLAGLRYKGHTDFLREFFKKNAIMMLGCEELYVALFTEHTPLKNVPAAITYERLKSFLLDLQKETGEKKIGVLGLNPHAGDHGVIGSEERVIAKAIDDANLALGKTVFNGPLVPDTAFCPKSRESCRLFVAMYHDQGLAPLKALYFEESINISLNLPVVRTSVDHGTAFDIAYTNKHTLSLASYVNAVKKAVEFINRDTQRS